MEAGTDTGAIPIEARRGFLLDMTFRDAVGAVSYLVALAVVAWLAFHGVAEAVGAIIALAMGGKEWFLRGRIEQPK